MTVLAVGVASLLMMLVSLLTVGVTDATRDRAQAQAAADAAALAAIAEAVPYGTGRPAQVARSYARLNGGRLVSCVCLPGAEAVQVVVAVDVAQASAKAVFDPDALAPADLAFSGDGLVPGLALALDRLLRAADGAVSVVSGFRSTADQSALWASALRRYGSAEAADDWVAPPGHSMHERGLAVDLGGDLATAARLVSDLLLPLHRPLPHEPWHFELIGSRR